MDYYNQKQFISQVDKNDAIIGKVEKWQAHKVAVLHRAFTMVLYYNDNLLLQHRRHPVFDGYFDLSFSSHQIYVGEKLESDEVAIYKTLKREWNIVESDLSSKPKKIGQIYYKEKDPNSDFYDHEIDYIYEGTLKHLPSPNYDFAYGFSVVPKKNFLTSKVYHLTSPLLAPWVKTMIEEKLI